MNSPFRSIAATLSLSAMLLRAILPVGWMPNAESASGAPLVICSVDGFHRVADRHDSSGKTHEDQSCPFAVLAHSAAPPLAIGVTQPSLAGRFAPHFANSDQVPPRIHLEYAPRGPPASA